MARKQLCKWVRSWILSARFAWIYFLDVWSTSVSHLPFLTFLTSLFVYVLIQVGAFCFPQPSAFYIHQTRIVQFWHPSLPFSKLSSRGRALDIIGVTFSNVGMVLWILSFLHLRNIRRLASYFFLFWSIHYVMSSWFELFSRHFPDFVSYFSGPKRLHLQHFNHRAGSC